MLSVFIKPLKIHTQHKDKLQTKMKKQTIITTAILILIASLTGVVSLLLFDNFKKKDLIAQQTEQIKESTIREDSLAIALGIEIENLNKIKEKYKELNEKNDEINLLIAKLTQEKENWKNRASLSKDQIIYLEKELKRTILDFENKRMAMLQEIEGLKLYTSKLSESNKTLKFSNDSLAAVTKDQVLVNKGILQKAGKLKAENLRVEVRDKKDKLLTKSPYKDNSITSISTIFNLSKNDLAPKGKRTLVMRIEKPDGGILYDASSNGNTFTTSANQQFYYTVAKDVNYNNGFEEVKLSYQKQIEMLDGTYNVQIFLDGDVVANTSFEIK